MITKQSRGEQRSMERLRRHYEIEKELADRIRHATKEERLNLYRTVYDELFQRVQDHPQVTAPSRLSHASKVQSQVRLVERFLGPDVSFLEIGGGDCALSFQIAPRIKMAYGVEITDQLIPQPAPDNFRFVLSDGSSIALPANSVDVAFSFSVVEHVHPEDFIEHLAEVFRVLKPGGIYYCVTPNRVLGPHDISRYFEDAAVGLHLKEYSVGEMAAEYRKAGFQELWVEKRLKSVHLSVPTVVMRVAEGLVEKLPRAPRSRMADNRYIAWALEVSVVGRKSR